MFPGKYFMKNVSKKKLNELIAHRTMLPIKFLLSRGSLNISLTSGFYPTSSVLPTFVPQGMIRGVNTGTHSSNLFDQPSYVPRSSFLT